jgi:hypothetical protein
MYLNICGAVIAPYLYTTNTYVDYDIGSIEKVGVI